MKKTMMLILIGCLVVAGPLFAMDQTLYIGAWAEVGDLLDYETPDAFTYKAEPYAEYRFGRTSVDKLTGGLYLSLDSPYVFETEIKTVRPSAEGWIDYRFMDAPKSLMEGGLWFYGTQDSTSGTYIDAYGYFDWYPINKAQDVTVHPHFPDVLQGVRIGVGVGGGAKVNQLLEDVAVTTDINADLVGLVSAGARMGESFWAMGKVQLGLANLAAPSSFDTFTIFSTAQMQGSLSYITEKFLISAAVKGYLKAADLITEDGLLEDPSYTYSYSAEGSLGFFLDRLYVYGGAELFGRRTSVIDNCVGYVGAAYYLL